jgi:hypothetical protein
LTEREDSVVPRGRQATCDGLRGEGVTALVDKRDRRKLELTIALPEKGQPALSFHGLLLSRERGIVAGTAQGGKMPRNSRFGSVLVRKSDASHILVRQ